MLKNRVHFGQYGALSKRPGKTIMRQARRLQLFIGSEPTTLKAGDTVIWNHANEDFTFWRGDTTLTINGDDDSHQMFGLQDPIDAIELLLLGLGSNLVANHERGERYDTFTVVPA